MEDYDSVANHESYDMVSRVSQSIGLLSHFEILDGKTWKETSEMIRHGQGLARWWNGDTPP